MPDSGQEIPAQGEALFSQVPLEVTVSVGRARPMVQDLLDMSDGSILTLDRRFDDPVELYIGDRLIARGELVELDGAQAGQLAVRLTEVNGQAG